MMSQAVAAGRAANSSADTSAPTPTIAARYFTQLPDTLTAQTLLARIAAAATNVGSHAVDKPLLLYGAGNLGQMAWRYLQRVGIAVQAVVDAQATKWRTDAAWQGVPVLAPDEVTQTQKEQTLLALTIANLPQAPLVAQLAAQGWRDVVPFYDLAEHYRDRHPLSNGWFAGDLSEDDLTQIDAVLARWDDDVSRAHHLQFIAWRRLRVEWQFEAAPVRPEQRFFIEPVLSALQAHDAFADVGAHFGHVAMQFAQRWPTYRHLWAIEPDPYNVRQLQLALAPLAERATILATAIAAHATEAAFFDDQGYASQLSPLGTRQQAITTLDALALEPNVIKLHLEGGELAALQGATQTLARCRPIVMATSYHNRDGLWRLPQWMAQQLPDYQLLLRVHSWCGTGAVIYAIPNERMPAQEPR